IAKEFSNHPKITQLSINQIPSDQQPIHIPPKTLQLFNKQLQAPHTLVSNAPMRLFQFTNFPKRTVRLCHSISKLEHPTTIIPAGASAAPAISL
ncbi:phosphoglycerate kinase, partial [Staphylococcus epidermidis]|uniref:phosphoglycerate kinase n=1 Tax=Staphylococcus epidermidis TaxID=1282 RepID=UPI0011AAF796